MIKKLFYNKRNNNLNLVVKILKDYFGLFLRVVFLYNRMNFFKIKFLICFIFYKKWGDLEIFER